MKMQYIDLLLKGYNDVLTATELMEVLNLSKNKVYELLKSNTISSRKIGTTYRIPKINVIDFLLNQE